MYKHGGGTVSSVAHSIKATEKLVFRLKRPYVFTVNYFCFRCYLLVFKRETQHSLKQANSSIKVDQDTGVEYNQLDQTQCNVPFFGYGMFCLKPQHNGSSAKAVRASAFDTSVFKLAEPGCL